MCQECRAGSAAPALMASFSAEQLGWGCGSFLAHSRGLERDDPWGPSQPKPFCASGILRSCFVPAGWGRVSGVRSLSWVLFPPVSSLEMKNLPVIGSSCSGAGNHLQPLTLRVCSTLLGHWILGSREGLAMAFPAPPALHSATRLVWATEGKSGS